MQRPIAVAKAKARDKDRVMISDRDTSAGDGDPAPVAEFPPFHPLDDEVSGVSGPSWCSSWDPSPACASLCVCYVLWVTLGLFGAHHFYMGRDKHAILWLSSFGAFGVGWFRDLFRLPAYVRLANRDWATCEMLRTSQRVHVRPPWSFLHRFGQCMFAWWFGVVLCGCLDTWAGLAGWQVTPIQPVPDLTWHAVTGAVTDPHSPSSVYVWFRLLKVAARTAGIVSGVWLVGGVNGTERCRSVLLLVVAAGLGQALTLYSWQHRDLDAPKGPDDTPDEQVTLATIDTSWYGILAAVLTYHVTRQWITIPPQPQPQSQHQHPATSNGLSRSGSGSRPRSVGRACRRMVVVLSVCVLLVLSLGTYTLTCVPFESESGDTVTLLEALRNFTNSPAYRDLMSALAVLYNEWRQHGTQHMFERFKQEFDVEGTAHAYQVLELDNDADFKAVRAAHRRLILKWHPDKHSPADKEAATRQFTNIQKAYETLEKLHKHKTQKQHHNTHTQEQEQEQKQEQRRTHTRTGTGTGTGTGTPKRSHAGTQTRTRTPTGTRTGTH